MGVRRRGTTRGRTCDSQSSIPRLLTRTRRQFSDQQLQSTIAPISVPAMYDAKLKRGLYAQCRFTSSIRPNNPQPRIESNINTHPLEDRLILRIAERDVVELKEGRRDLLGFLKLEFDDVVRCWQFESNDEVSADITGEGEGREVLRELLENLDLRLSLRCSIRIVYHPKRVNNSLD